jgi:hypothetical protein
MHQGAARILIVFAYLQTLFDHHQPDACVEVFEISRMVVECS